MQSKTLSRSMHTKREPPHDQKAPSYIRNHVAGYGRSNLIQKPLISGYFILFLLLTLLFNGCYHYRVVAPDPEPATDYQSRVAHSLFWGLVQSKDISADDCLSNAMDEVRVTTNLGYSAISVATLGIWTPMNIQWRCAKEPLQEGEI